MAKIAAEIKELAKALCEKANENISLDDMKLELNDLILTSTPEDLKKSISKMNPEQKQIVKSLIKELFEKGGQGSGRKRGTSLFSSGAAKEQLGSAFKQSRAELDKKLKEKKISKEEHEQELRNQAVFMKPGFKEEKRKFKKSSNPLHNANEFEVKPRYSSMEELERDYKLGIITREEYSELVHEVQNFEQHNIVNVDFDVPIKKAKKPETAPSLKPPKAWFDQKAKEVKAGNPKYTEEQVNATVGDIWYNKMSKKQKGEKRKAEGKKYGKAPEMKKSMITPEVIELVKEKMDLEKAAKGEGSRGGKVIGHTRSGKPIYAKYNKLNYLGFSKEEHKDAAAVHLHHEKGAVSFPEDTEAERKKSKEKRSSHSSIREKHMEAGDLYEDDVEEHYKQHGDVILKKPKKIKKSELKQELIDIINELPKDIDSSDSLEKAYMGFEKVKAAAAKGGAKDPAAVAATVGRKKYGKEKFAKLIAGGKPGGKKGEKMTPQKEKKLQKSLDDFIVKTEFGVDPSTIKKSLRQDIVDSAIKTSDFQYVAGFNASIDDYVAYDEMLKSEVDEAGYVIEKSDQTRFMENVALLSDDMVKNLGLSEENINLVKTARDRILSKAQEESDKKIKDLIKKAEDKIKPSPIVAIEVEKEEESEGPKFRKNEARDFIEAKIRLRCHFYMPSQDELLIGGKNMDEFKPKFNLKAQEMFDSITMEAKDCEAVAAGIRSVDWSVDFVRSVIKDYYKLISKNK